MYTNCQKERGQALVLIVLAVFAVFGFSALAIDGGMLYAERRRAQNAADQSVLAAAMSGLNGGDWHAAGISQATMNGFTSDAKNIVTVNNPPASGPYMNRTDYYQVIITTEFSPFFSQIIYSGKLQNTVEAVARAKPSQSISPGNAIHATSANQCHAVWFQGSSGTILYDAGIYSNSNAVGSENCAAVAKKSGDLTIQNGNLTSVGGILNKNDIVFKDELGNTITGTSRNALITENTQTPLDITNITPPVCNGIARDKDDTGNLVGGIYYLQPGVYADGINVGNDEVHLARGIYCLDDDLVMTSSNGVIIGDAGVLIYMRGPENNISLNGGRMELASATGTPLYDNATPPKDWSGMLVYMGYDNRGTIDITGGANSKLWGTIYAPGDFSGGAKSAKCDLTGNADTFNYRAQLICHSVRVTGDVTLRIHYEETEQYREPPTIELTQ